jgi:Flp pilus assembly pilin Flp
MCASSNSLARDRRGGSAIEFALIAPVLLALILGVTEIARFINHADAVEKSLRSAAAFAARSEVPLDGATLTKVENLVRTGTPDGTGDFIVPGWAEAGASILVQTFTATVGGVDHEVIRLTATVPFVPITPALVEMFGLGDLQILSSHEQTHMGI